MSKNNKFSPEVRERAVRLVQEHRDEYRSLWAAIESIAPKIGCTPTTLLAWIKRSEVDSNTVGARCCWISYPRHTWYRKAFRST